MVRGGGHPGLTEDWSHLPHCLFFAFEFILLCVACYLLAFTLCFMVFNGFCCVFVPFIGFCLFRLLLFVDDGSPAEGVRPKDYMHSLDPKIHT